MTLHLTLRKTKDEIFDYSVNSHKVYHSDLKVNSKSRDKTVIRTWVVDIATGPTIHSKSLFLSVVSHPPYEIPSTRSSGASNIPPLS